MIGAMLNKIDEVSKEDAKPKEYAPGHKWVYSYGNGEVEGDPTMKNLLGGKGVGLAEMTSIGIPVPPGFTITTEVCNYYYDHDHKYPDDLWDQVFKAMEKIEKYNNKKFSDVNDPLLVSCRSGARVSMPGMMDTILNLGLNDQTVEGLAKKSGNERFAYDSYSFYYFDSLLIQLLNFYFLLKFLLYNYL